MAFSKSFPRRGKSNNTIWEDIVLTVEEEAAAEREADEDNKRLMDECLEEAKALLSVKDLNVYQADLVRIAVALFEKRASHSVYWKERKCRDKFDELFPQH